MLPFGVTIPATVPQRSKIPERLRNYPVYVRTSLSQLVTYKQSFAGYVTVSSICVMKHNYSDHIKGDETNGACSIHIEACKGNIHFWIWVQIGL